MGLLDHDQRPAWESLISSKSVTLVERSFSIFSAMLNPNMMTSSFGLVREFSHGESLDGFVIYFVMPPFRAGRDVLVPLELLNRNLLAELRPSTAPFSLVLPHH